MFKTNHLKPLGKLCILIFKTFSLIDVKDGQGENGEYTEINNLTLINLVLKVLGPLHERTVVIILLSIQVSLESQLVLFITF